MIHFGQYLTEDVEKNVHLEHLEDSVLNNGVKGARDAIHFLLSLRDMLLGHTREHFHITTKWDGAPSIFAGPHPETGKFFVATKSIFAKNAKLNYTDADIEENHPSESLANKLKTVLRYLPELGMTEILQGDLMFTHSDLKKETIDGEVYITFQPNTIVYAVPIDSKLAQSMLRAKMGIVFHTTYRGKTIQGLKAEFRVDIGTLKHTPDVWYRDATFVDVSGEATFTEEETVAINDVLSQAGRVFQSLDPRVINQISLQPGVLQDIKTFNNTKVREGVPIKDPRQHTQELIYWITDKHNTAIKNAVQKQTKEKRIAEKNATLRFYTRNARQLELIFQLHNDILKAKLMILRKLQSVKSMGTFLRTPDGFAVTDPEGFVAVDHIKGNALKLVDRLSFSHANFNAAKTWDK